MPRVNLTEEEAAHIERLRVKNTGDLNWNAAIDRALVVLDEEAAHPFTSESEAASDALARAKTRLELEFRKISFP